MVEFSEEQELEVQKRIDDAAKFEQWRIAFAQAARIVTPYLEGMTDQYDPKTQQLVREGAIDPFVVTVFKTEMRKKLMEYFPQQKAPEEKKPDGE